MTLLIKVTKPLNNLVSLFLEEGHLCQTLQSLAFGLVYKSGGEGRGDASKHVAIILCCTLHFEMSYFASSLISPFYCVIYEIYFHLLLQIWSNTIFWLFCHRGSIRECCSQSVENKFYIYTSVTNQKIKFPVPIKSTLVKSLLNFLHILEMFWQWIK